MTDKEAVMLIKGHLVELMVMADPTLGCKYVINNSKRVTLSYVKMNKALFSILKSALLFYKNLRGDYRLCDANKKINITQMTITWHGDDLKVSHKDTFIYG